MKPSLFSTSQIFLHSHHLDWQTSHFLLELLSPRILQISQKQDSVVLKGNRFHDQKVFPDYQAFPWMYCQNHLWLLLLVTFSVAPLFSTLPSPIYESIPQHLFLLKKEIGMELKAKMRLGSGYLFWQKFQKMGFPIQQPVVFLPWWKHASAFQGQSCGGGGGREVRKRPWSIRNLPYCPPKWQEDLQSRIEGLQEFLPSNHKAPPMTPDLWRHIPRGNHGDLWTN